MVLDENLDYIFKISYDFLQQSSNYQRKLLTKNKQNVTYVDSDVLYDKTSLKLLWTLIILMLLFYWKLIVGKVRPHIKVAKDAKEEDSG